MWTWRFQMDYRRNLVHDLVLIFPPSLLIKINGAIVLLIRMDGSKGKKVWLFFILKSLI